MSACFLPIAFLSLAAFGQTMFGTVEKIDKDQLQIKTHEGIVTLHVDERTTVRKGSVRNDVSALAAGDEIRATCYGQAVITAANISAEVTFSGVITEASLGHIKVNREEASGGGRPNKSTESFVFLEPRTRVAANQKPLSAGQTVDVVGWDSGDGVVEAIKVTLRNPEQGTARRARPVR